MHGNTLDTDFEHGRTSESDLTAITSPDKTWKLKFEHLGNMLTDTGIWQHSIGDKPDVKHGYSIDDEARGLIIAIEHWKNGVEPDFNARMGMTCFNFLRNAALSGPDIGLYHNFCDKNGKWLDPTGSPDSFGRTLWALGIAYRDDAPFAPRKLVSPLLKASTARIPELKYSRSKAFAIVGLSASGTDDQLLTVLCDELCALYELNSSPEWRWFENAMTYCNARLPHALIEASRRIEDSERCLRIGLESLDFLLRSTRSYGSYAPIGNAPMATAGWYNRGDDAPPTFDQQPVDAAALVESCSAAFAVSGQTKYRTAALDAFNWYMGANIHKKLLYNLETGGVADAITTGGVSGNQGAESVVTFHLAVQALNRIV